MHFALPPRKTSRPPPYLTGGSPRRSYFKRARLRSWAWILLGVICFILLLSRLRGGRGDYIVEDVIPPGTPEVVLVTVIDPSMDASYNELVIQNREDYANRHGYALFIANTTNYPLNDPPIPKSWARIPATRHAMALFKHSTYFFQLDPDSLILQPSLTLNTHITDPSRITSLYLPNRPVVPPDSVIKTYPSRSASQIDLILTQDHEGLAQTSFILKRGAFADFFLDTWFDPLYRSYNFQRAEGHALEHLVQWHGTVLSRLALIPQRTMNSYYGGGNHDEKYRVGDFVARLQGCQNTEGACEMMGKRLVKEARDWEVGHSGKTEIKARGEEEAPIDARVLSTVVF